MVWVVASSVSSVRKKSNRSCVFVQQRSPEPTSFLVDVNAGASSYALVLVGIENSVWEAANSVIESAARKMVLSECYGFIKYALVCVNLIFGTVGLVSVVLAICMLADQTFLVSLAQQEHNFHAGLYILLAAGNLMLIVAFLGCYGAFRESRCMLVGFFSCLLVVIVAQIAAGAWLYTNRSGLEDLVKTSVIHTVKNEYGGFGPHPASTQTVDAFQSTLGCCGATGPADWAGSKYANKDATLGLSLTVSTDTSMYKVPESCCKDKDSTACEIGRNIKVAGIISPLIYDQGCVDKLVDVLSSQSCIVMGVAIGIGILELLGLIFCLVLCCAIGSSDRYKA